MVKVYDIKTEKELTPEEIADQLHKAVKAGKWRVAAYYNQLMARAIIEELRARSSAGTTTPPPGG